MRHPRRGPARQIQDCRAARWSRNPVRTEILRIAVVLAEFAYRRRADSRRMCRLARNNIDRRAANRARTRQFQLDNLAAIRPAAMSPAQGIGLPPRRPARSPLPRPIHDRVAAPPPPGPRAAAFGRHVGALRKGPTGRSAGPIPLAGHCSRPLYRRARGRGFGAHDKDVRCCQPKERSASDIKLILLSPSTMVKAASARAIAFRSAH